MIPQGTLLAGRYEVEILIGSGGMADVYRALDRTLGRYVAIKLLKPEFSEDMTFVTKFRAEAQAAAGLEHPNIVNVYDVGVENGMYYIVMEYVEGITLKRYIEKKGHLNYKETLSIAIQVARGIQSAHLKKIIHRDIKPQNIIISREGKVKVTDFGIARAVSDNTMHTDVMGSVHYASPEQLRNGYVSERSDIYSLGIVLYEMVTGRVPFDGESTVAVAIKHLQEEMIRPSAYVSDIPISLEKIILKCTQKSPSRRYESMESLLLDLRKALLSPNEDFVVMVPAAYDYKSTKALTENDLQQIKDQSSSYNDAGRGAGRSVSRSDSYSKRRDPEYDDDYDDDDRYDDRYDDEDEDDFLNPKVRKIVKILLIVVLIVIILVVVYLIGSIFGIFKFSISDIFGKNDDTSVVSEMEEETAEYTMINVVGMTVDEAQSQVTAQGMDITIAVQEYVSSDESENTIISQLTAEGQTVYAGDTVYVTAASGQAEQITVPDVSGQTADDAQQTLEDAGFEVTREFAYDTSVDQNYVISQSPSANTTAPKGTTVTITVSQGSETAQVPDVTGKDGSSAKSLLEANGFYVGETTTAYSDDVDSGSVISQSVEGGTYAEIGTSVDLVISEGAETKSYYYSATVTAPDGIEVQYADIVLYGGDTSNVIKEWTNVTAPYSISINDITDYTYGSLQVTWHYLDEAGADQTIVNTFAGDSVQFKEQ